MKHWTGKAYKPKGAKTNAPAGEAVTEFSKADGRGPFQCGNSVHQQGGYCHHPVMMENSKQPKDKEGYVEMGHGDCCKFVRRKGD